MWRSLFNTVTIELCNTLCWLSPITRHIYLLFENTIMLNWHWIQCTETVNLNILSVSQVWKIQSFYCLEQLWQFFFNQDKNQHQMWLEMQNNCVVLVTKSSSKNVWIFFYFYWLSFYRSVQFHYQNICMCCNWGHHEKRISNKRICRHPFALCLAVNVYLIKFQICNLKKGSIWGESIITSYI